MKNFILCLTLILSGLFLFLCVPDADLFCPCLFSLGTVTTFQEIFQPVRSLIINDNGSVRLIRSRAS